jgi:transposase
MSVLNDDIAPGERRRRSWTLDEKRRIVDETLQDGASIAEVARRHELNANPLFTWRRKMGVEPSEPTDPMEMVPVTIARGLAAEEYCPNT